MTNIRTRGRFRFAVLGTAALILYTWVGLFGGLFFDNVMIGTIVVDLISAAVVIPSFLHFFAKDVDGVRYDQSIGDDMLPWLFLFAPILWFFTQCFGVYTLNHIYDPAMESYQAATSLDTGAYVILTLFVAPVLEEYLLRGISYVLFRRSMKWYTAALLTSALFGAMHGTITHFYVAAMFGFFSCIVFEYTGRIKYSVGFHFLNNLLSLVVGFIPVPSFFFENVIVVLSSNIVCVSVLFAIFVRLNGFLKEKSDGQDSVVLDASVPQVDLQFAAVSVDMFSSLFDGGESVVRFHNRSDGDVIRPCSCVVLCDWQDDDRLVVFVEGSCVSGAIDSDRPVTLLDVSAVMSDRVYLSVVDTDGVFVYCGAALGVRLSNEPWRTRRVVQAVPCFDNLSVSDAESFAYLHITVE